MIQLNRVFMDTSAWFASIVHSAPNHARAWAWIRPIRTRLVTTDYVIDETLTLLRSRRGPPTAIAFGKEILLGDLVEIEWVTPEIFKQAWDVFRTHADKNWSFPDCTSKVVMDRLGIHQAFTFDKHFRRFGNVKVLPEGEFP